MNNFFELAKNRYSVRSFSDKPIEKEKLDAILACGKVAPSAKNQQPTRVYVAQSEEAVSALNKICRCIYGAKTVLVVGYFDDRACHTENRATSFGEMDASILCTHLMLGAWDLGIGSCWVGLFSSEEVKNALHLPENFTVSALLPVGYPTADCVPSERHTLYRPDEELFVRL